MLHPLRLTLQQKEEQKDNVNLRERRNSFNTSGTNGNSPESQLKYENDKLKLALAQRYVRMQGTYLDFNI